MPEVSVIIPAYNKADLTVKTVQSVLVQTYKDLEILVVDDGSTDQTKERMLAFGDKIQYIHKPNGGACSARNLGIRRSRGTFIAFLDCDDLYDEKKIELSVGYLKKNPKFGYVHTDAYFIDQDGGIIRKYSHPRARKEGWVARKLVLGNFICNSTVVVRREILEKAGLFDESIFTPADWDLWIRLAEVAPVGYLNMPLTGYRVTDNYIFRRIELAQKEEGAVIENFFKRNPRWNHLRSGVLSNYHLRYAECYFLKDNENRLREEFFSSLKFNPLNFKAIVLFFYYLLAQRHLRRNLHQRILRTNESA